MHLLEAACNSELQMDLIAYSSAINVCGQGQWQQATKTLQRIHGKVLQANIICYNSVIGAIEGAALWKQPFELQNLMCTRAFLPDVITACTMLAACRSAPNWSQAFDVFTRCSKLDLRVDIILQNNAISAVGDQWWLATSLLERLLYKYLRLTLITCNSLLNACEKSGHWTKAMLFLMQAVVWSFKVDEFSYSASISACEKGHQWAKALHFLGPATWHTVKGVKMN
eukprot:symbB.v1.2.018475.t1/scaffold1476.1/size116376/4